MSRIIYLLDRQTQKTYIISKPETYLGRSQTDIPMSGDSEHESKRKTVSRNHCKLIRCDLGDIVVEDPNAKLENITSGLGVVDLDSMNGTYVNRRKINNRAFPLTNGDVLSLGNYAYEVIMEDSKPATEQTATSQTVPIQIKT